MIVFVVIVRHIHEAMTVICTNAVATGTRMQETTISLKDAHPAGVIVSLLSKRQKRLVLVRANGFISIPPLLATCIVSEREEKKRYEEEEEQAKGHNEQVHHRPHPCAGRPRPSHTRLSRDGFSTSSLQLFGVSYFKL